ncbi:MAG TPA: RNA methyltransferase [Bacteroidales bacterium]|nr:RNA methyltransferase [Bacteroidales bacterium]HRT90030.1 RNA methyltransferase [Bacteroidales bacterium]
MRKKLNSELGRMSIEDFRRTGKNPVAVVLDNIRSHNNTGSVFRTCDAFLVEELFLCGITPVPPHRDIQKTALGATESVSWQYFKTAEEAIRILKEKGYLVIAVEQVEGAVELQDLRVEKGKKYAFVFGHEINGVSQEAVDLSDICVEIPQFGTKHSFNIAVSAGIVLWDFTLKISALR